MKLFYFLIFGGASRDRTDDLVVANDALSQLSYSPTAKRRECLPNYSSKAAGREMRLGRADGSRAQLRFQSVERGVELVS